MREIGHSRQTGRWPPASDSSKGALQHNFSQFWPKKREVSLFSTLRSAATTPTSRKTQIFAPLIWVKRPKSESWGAYRQNPLARKNSLLAFLSIFNKNNVRALHRRPIRPIGCPREDAPGPSTEAHSAHRSSWRRPIRPIGCPREDALGPSTVPAGTVASRGPRAR